MTRITWRAIAVAALFWGALWPAFVTHASEETPKTMGEYRGTKSTEYPDWFKESFLEFLDDIDEAAADGRRVMVMFHQHNCPYCNALVTRNLSQKHIEEKVREHFDVVALNMWGDREVVSVDGHAYSEKQFAEALAVQFTPTLIFFDEQGKVVLRLNGYLPPRRFELALDYVAFRKEKEIAYRSYVASRLPPSSSGQLNQQDFFAAPPHDLAGMGDGGKPIAVFFEQKQCPNCDTLHQGAMSDPITRGMLAEFTCLQLDMWSSTPVVTPSGQKRTARQWAEDLDVKYAPTIVLFNPAGQEVIRSDAQSNLPPADRPSIAVLPFIKWSTEFQEQS